MAIEAKYEFFAPIWRVMRDENMTPTEVRTQVQHVALSVKQGTQVNKGFRHEAGLICGLTITAG